MKINKGLNLHNTNNNKEAGSWSHALNIEYSKDLMSITNSAGNIEINDTFFESQQYKEIFRSLKCIGTIDTPNEIVLFMGGKISFAYNLEAIECLSVWRLKKEELKFCFYTNHYSTKKEIIGTYKYNYKNELIVTWCNGIEAESDIVIVINLDNLPKGFVNNSYQLPNFVNNKSILETCSISKFSPFMNFANVEIISGNLENGIYEFFMSYIKDENTISYQTITNKIILSNVETTKVRSVISKVRQKPEGQKTGNPHYEMNTTMISLIGNNSFKGIKLNISIENNSLYDTANIVCKFTNESNVVSYYNIEEILINQNNVSIVFNDNKNATSIDASILIDTMKIQKCKAIESHIDKLYIGNYLSEEVDDKELEGYATSIGLSAIATEVKEETNTEALSSNIISSFQPGEVYAFYVHFVDKYGNHTKGYHIPFNQYTSGSVKGSSGKYCSGFSIHQNQTEKYKYNNEGVDLGWFQYQNVRHHFFDYPEENTVWKKYGIKIDNFPELSERLKAKYISFYISYAKKNYNNSRVLSTGAVFAPKYEAYGWVAYGQSGTVSGPQLIYYPNTDDDDPMFNNTVDNHLRFNEMGLLHNEPKINPSEIKVMYNIYNNYYKNYMSYNNSYNGYLHNFINTGKSHLRNGTLINNAYSVNANRYLPDNNSAVVPKNLYREKSLYLHVNSAGNSLFENIQGGHPVMTSNYQNHRIDSNFITEFIEFFVVQLLNTNIKDFHYNYENQKDLIRCTDFYHIDDINYEPISYNGDAFLGVQEFVKALHPAQRVIIRFPAINRFVPQLRKYVAPSDMTTGIDSGNLANSRAPVNNYTYNNGFHEQTSTKTREAFNREIFDKSTTLFPMNVARSRVQQTESLNEAWTQFDALEYRTLNEKREEIISLKSDGRNLYVQSKTSLFIMQTKDELKTANEITVALSDSDMFANYPLEVMYDDKGLIGCNSRFANVLTPIGYMVFDSSKDSIYLVQNGTPKLISENIYELKSKWKDIEFEDDPAITGRGNRLFLDTISGKNLVYFLNYNNNNSFNVSYNLNASQFVSFHSFIPLNIASTRKDLFSVDQTKENDKLITKIFIYNQGIVPRYNNVIYPSYIDVVLSNDQVFKLQSIFWDSNFKSTNNVEQYNKTFSDIALYNNKNCTGLINLKKGRYTTNRGVKNMWYFNNIRDNVLNKNELFIDKDGNFIDNNLAGKNGKIKNFFDKSKFFSNFVVVRLYYNNEEELKFYLNELKIKGQV